MAEYRDATSAFTVHAGAYMNSYVNLPPVLKQPNLTDTWSLRQGLRVATHIDITSQNKESCSQCFYTCHIQDA